jgi:hypothetical protein
MTVPADPPSVPSSPDPLLPLARLWYVRIPRALDRVSTLLADQFADGVWTASFRLVGALVPPIALLVGFLIPHTWPGIQFVYTEALVFLILAAAVGFLSGTAGIALVVGYVVADLLAGGLLNIDQNKFDRQIGQFAGHLVTDVLLAALIVVLPNLARRMAEEIALPFAPEAKTARLAARAALFGASAGILVFLWCQAMIALVRPAFTWAHHAPTTQAVAPLQDSWPWIAGAAAIAAVVRLVAEQWTGERPQLASRVVALIDARWAPPLRRGSTRVPPFVRVAGIAALTTFLLAGMYESLIDPVLMFAAVFALGAWRSHLFFRPPAVFVGILDRVPSIVRLVLAAVIGYVVAQAVMNPLYQNGDLRVVLIGALVSLLVLAVVFPGPRRAAPPPSQVAATGTP